MSDGRTTRRDALMARVAPRQAPKPSSNKPEICTGYTGVTNGFSSQ
jgi:hypothetical protein